LLSRRQVTFVTTLRRSVEIRRVEVIFAGNSDKRE
jgi:hypothetical protein